MTALELSAALRAAAAGGDLRAVKNFLTSGVDPKERSFLDEEAVWVDDSINGQGAEAQRRRTRGAW